MFDATFALSQEMRDEKQESRQRLLVLVSWFSFLVSWFFFHTFAQRNMIL